MDLAKECNISFVPLILLSTGKLHRVAPNFLKWLYHVAIPGSNCEKR